MAISLSGGIPFAIPDENAAAVRMPPVLREELIELLDASPTLPWCAPLPFVVPAGRRAAVVESMAKRTESMPEGARQSWILTEPVVGVRIPGSPFDYFLGQEEHVIEVGSEPAPPANGSPQPRRMVVRSPHVSRLHCTIERRNDRWIVVAHPGAKNGIYVGDANQGERRTMIELVPGLRFSIGSVPFVAYSGAEMRARVAFRRYFGLGDAHAATVDGVLALANGTRHVIVQQPTGGGGLAIAQAIHDASPRVTWPFIAPGKLGDTRREWLAVLNATAYGTLALRSEQLPVHREELLRLLASWEYPVRLVLIMPRAQRAANVVGDALLTSASLVTVPTIAERRDELVGLVALLCQEAGLTLGIAGAALTPKLWAYMERHTWPENLEELERFVERALAVRLYKGKLRKAAAALGNVSAAGMIKWARRHNVKALIR
jgi:hypothetical protein